MNFLVILILVLSSKGKRKKENTIDNYRYMHLLMTAFVEVVLHLDDLLKIDTGRKLYKPSILIFVNVCH